MEQHTYRYLKGLVNSDYQIVSGEPNIIGWEVKNESDTYLGEIKDLLFDPQTNAVRYLIIDLQDNGMNLNDKKVMIPIGIAHLHTSADEVVLPNVHQEQFNALPAYQESELSPNTEVQIRSIIGSPAALRLEETATEFDQNQFYAHHHFNEGQFFKRGGPSQASTSGSEALGDRTAAQQTIRHLIDESNQHDHHAASPTTGQATHHNEQHQVKPWLEYKRQQEANDEQQATQKPDDLDPNKLPYGA